MKLAGHIVWFRFITIIWSICFIRMGDFLDPLLNIPRIFLRGVLLQESCLKKSNVLLLQLVSSALVNTVLVEPTRRRRRGGTKRFWWGEMREKLLFCFFWVRIYTKRQIENFLNNKMYLCVRNMYLQRISKTSWLLSFENLRHLFSHWLLFLFEQFEH